jgi:DDE superfamily endonuclease/Helix-turn-helix of DDE superfamily endonuclease
LRVRSMIARLDNLRKHPAVFRHLTGITVEVFDTLAEVVVPAVEAAHKKALDRPDRQRAIGGGDDFDLPLIDHVLVTVVWLRQYPTQEVLGFLFGVSDSTARRAVERCLPVLEQAGKDTMRMPDPGRGRRKKLPALLKDTPGLAVVIDSFEQRTQRPKRRQRAYYSGKKKAHTLKSQVAVDEQSGRIVDVSDSVPGRWADIKLLKTSRLLTRLPEGVGGIGDLGYVGIGELHPAGLGASPRRKPRGKERPPEDRKYNRAFSRRRIIVEHGIGRLRRFAAVSHVNRHRRKGHAVRVRAIAGLVNRMLDA